MLEEMPPEAKPGDPFWTTNIMTYELGSLIRALVRRHIKVSQHDEKGANSYLQEARIELADLITQCRVLAEEMGWKWFELKIDGHERFVERMQEIRAGTL